MFYDKHIMDLQLTGSVWFYFALRHVKNLFYVYSMHFFKSILHRNSYTQLNESIPIKGEYFSYTTNIQIVGGTLQYYGYEAKSSKP